MPTYRVTCIETILLTTEVEVEDHELPPKGADPTELEAFYQALIETAHDGGGWEEETQGTEDNKVYRVDSPFDVDTLVYAEEQGGVVPGAE